MFDFTKEQEKKSYLNQCGTYQGVEFTGLIYEAAQNYECFDLNFNVNGSLFKDRTFGTTLENALQKNIKVDGEMRLETREEAYQRTYKEIFFKLLYIVSCFVDEAEARKYLGTFTDLKDLVDKANELINKVGTLPKLNILTVWKNRDSVQKANLIIPERIQWVEVTQYDTEGNMKPATIKLTDWQQRNMTINRWPYNGGATPQGDSAILNDIANKPDDLPF